MIGKLVEHILEAGFDVYVQKKERMMLLQISKWAGGDVCTVQWAISHEEIVNVPSWFLQDACNRKLQLLQNEITKKEADKE